jgi:transposase
MAHPTWVLEYRTKGKEVKKISGNYYLYEVSSFYDKERKKTLKKSGKFLGRITESGFIAKGERSLEAVPRRVCVKEEGASLLLLGLLKEEISLLQVHLPSHWESIIVCSIFRLLHQSAFKQMQWHYESSYLSELYNNLPLSGKQISTWLRAVGENREALVNVMKGLQGGEDCIIVDNTHITTLSRKNLSAQVGYNSQRQFDTQVNLLYLFCQDKQMPIFYRCIQGSVREVRSLQLTMEESGLKSAILVADKGFYSENNVTILDKENWQYVLPLRRNSHLTDYELLKTGNKKDFDGFFLFEKRAIWYKVYENEDKNVHKRTILFLDESLKVCETEDYLRRISQEKEGYSLESFHEKQIQFGTISVLTNTTQTQIQVEKGKADLILTQKMTAQKVFEYLKSRNDIEQLNDTYKNVLQADKTYMQSEPAMEAWHFINFLAIRAYYRLFAILNNIELSAKFSPSDVLLLLQCKKKVKINQKWVEAEIPKKAQAIIDKIAAVLDP